jgi:hypothetical protein
MIDDLYKEYVEGYGQRLKDNDPDELISFLGQTLERLDTQQPTEEVRALTVMVLSSRSRVLNEVGERKRALEDARKAYDLYLTQNIQLYDLCSVGTHYATLLADSNHIIESASVLAKVMLACVEDKSGAILGSTLSDFCHFANDKQNAFIAIQRASSLMLNS